MSTFNELIGYKEYAEYLPWTRPFMKHRWSRRALLVIQAIIAVIAGAVIGIAEGWRSGTGELRREWNDRG